MSSSVPRGTDHALIAIALTTSLLYAVYLAVLPIFLPLLGGEYGLGTSVQGRLFPASFGGSLSGVFLCGYLSDRWGRKRVLLGCLIAAGLGFLLFGRASAFPMVLLAAFLTGAGGSAAQTVATALLTDHYPERRAALINAVQVSFGVGAIVGPLAAQATLESLSWRGFLTSLAIFQALMLVAVLLTPLSRPGRQEGASPSGPGLRTGWRSLSLVPLILLCVSAFLYAGSEVALFSWAPTYLQSLPDGAAVKGWVVSAFWVAMTVGRASLPLLINRFPLAGLRILLAGGAALIATMTLLTTPPVAILIGTMATGLMMSGLFSLLLAEGSERYRETTGTALGLIAGSGSAGAGFLPWLIGALKESGCSWTISLSVIPLACVLVAILAVPATRSDRLTADNRSDR